jgi:hypothetical protein
MRAWFRKRIAESDAVQRVYVPTARIACNAANGVNVEVIEHELEKISRRNPWRDTMLVKERAQSLLSEGNTAYIETISEKLTAPTGFTRTQDKGLAVFSVNDGCLLPLRRDQMQRFESWISLIADELRAAEVKNLRELTVVVTYTYVQKEHA